MALPIDNCERCGDHFNRSPLLQAEVTHEIRKYGQRQGHSLMLELMEPVHEGHIEEEHYEDTATTNR